MGRLSAWSTTPSPLSKAAVVATTVLVCPITCAVTSSAQASMDLRTREVEATNTSNGVNITSCSKYTAARHPGRTPRSILTA
eukprot:6222200-Pyramimonas_sp.AAC.1